MRITGGVFLDKAPRAPLHFPLVQLPARAASKVLHHQPGRVSNTKTSLSRSVAEICVLSVIDQAFIKISYSVKTFTGYRGTESANVGVFDKPILGSLSLQTFHLI